MSKKVKKKRINEIIYGVIQGFLYLISYTLVFICVDAFFDTFKIDSNHLYMYSFIAVVLIYVLNKTVKPILFSLTLPITGITLGLFYFVNNMIILKLVEFIMNNKVEFTSLPILFFISIVLSIFNLLMESVFIKPFMKKVKSYE